MVFQKSTFVQEYPRGSAQLHCGDIWQQWMDEAESASTQDAAQCQRDGQPQGGDGAENGLPAPPKIPSSKIEYFFPRNKCQTLQKIFCLYFWEAVGFFFSKVDMLYGSREIR